VLVVSKSFNLLKLKSRSFVNSGRSFSYLFEVFNKKDLPKILSSIALLSTTLIIIWIIIVMR